jgi:hypothetical protein
MSYLNLNIILVRPKFLVKSGAYLISQNKRQAKRVLKFTLNGALKQLCRKLATQTRTAAGLVWVQ